MASLLARFTRSHQSTITMLAEATPKALEHSFTTYARDGYQGNGPVFSLIATRALALKGVRFAYQTRERPLKLSLGPPLLDRPWKGGTTSQLISRMEVDDSLAGNS